MKRLPSGYRAIAEALLVVFILILGGTLGYMLVEKWSFFDSLYMCVITLTTVGYQEVQPLSALGRAFTIGLLLTGVFSLFYASTAAIRVIVGGELTARRAGGASSQRGRLHRARHPQRLHGAPD